MYTCRERRREKEKDWLIKGLTSSPLNEHFYSILYYPKGKLHNGNQEPQMQHFCGHWLNILCILIKSILIVFFSIASSLITLSKRNIWYASFGHSTFLCCSKPIILTLFCKDYRIPFSLHKWSSVPIFLAQHKNQHIFKALITSSEDLVQRWIPFGIITKEGTLNLQQ